MYYEPWNSVYHEVEQTGEIDESNRNDTKVSSTKIKIGARLDIAGLVKAAIEYTMERIKPEAKSNEYRGVSSVTGDYGVSSATGNCGASSATGYKGSAIAGDQNSIAIAWGYHGKAKGVKGSYLVLADWDGNEKNYWTQNEWSLNGAKMVRVDGVNIKENVYYTMANGEIVEAE